MGDFEAHSADWSIIIKAVFFNDWFLINVLFV